MPGLQRLESEFRGEHEGDYLLLDKVGSHLLINRSNMMQGVLHFTSSMLHAAHLKLTQEMTYKIITESSAKTTKFLETNGCSSDDSYSIKTILYKNNHECPKRLMNLMRM